MKFTINELRQLVIQELATIGDAEEPDFGVEGDDEIDAAALGTLQQKMAEYDDKIKDLNRQLAQLEQALRSVKKKDDEKETGAAAEEITDILGTE